MQQSKFTIDSRRRRADYNAFTSRHDLNTPDHRSSQLTPHQPKDTPVAKSSQSASPGKFRSGENPQKLASSVGCSTNQNINIRFQYANGKSLSATRRQFAGGILLVLLLIRGAGPIALRHRSHQLGEARRLCRYESESFEIDRISSLPTIKYNHPSRLLLLTF